MTAHFPSLAYALQLKGKTLVQIMDIYRDCNIELGLLSYWKPYYCKTGHEEDKKTLSDLCHTECK